MMLNIILLDEVAEHNSLLKTLLEQEITALGEQAEYRSAVTGEEAVAFAAQTNGPSIYLLDIELGTESNGIDAAYRLRVRLSAVRHGLPAQSRFRFSFQARFFH